MSRVIRPVYDPVKAGALGITKASMMESVKSINDGLPVGVYRVKEKKVPVLLKSGNVDIADIPFFRRLFDMEWRKVGSAFAGNRTDRDDLGVSPGENL